MPFCDWCSYSATTQVFFHVTSKGRTPAYDELWPFTEKWYEVRERIEQLAEERDIGGGLESDLLSDDQDMDYDYDSVAEHNMAT